MPMAPNESRGRISPVVIAGVVLVVAFALIAARQMLRPQQQEDLVEQIQAVGGFVTNDPPPTLAERISAYQSGSGWLATYSAVGLYTSDITGEWLRKHDNLAALKITDLKLSETALTDVELARLVEAHPLHVLQLREEQVGEETVAALAGRKELMILELRDCPIGDDQLARLPLEQLDELRIDGTRVTPEGLEALRRAQKIVELTIDGRQLSDGTGKLLNAMPQLRDLQLFGSAVTDEHLDQLHNVPQLEFIQLSRTAVSDDGVKLLRAALPKCDVVVR